MSHITPNHGRASGVPENMTTFALEHRPARVRARTRTVVDVDAAVREVYLAHFGALAGWATHLVGDRDLGHDLATDAFVRLINSWPGVDQPRPWLYTTVGNLVKDHWRKRGRERASYQRFQGGLDPETAVAHGPDTATSLSVREAVESLPDRLRLAVLLHYFADLTVTEVARQLGKADGTIKRDLHEARARLAATLESAR
ncbi:RNA polymerase sigma factor [Ornithinimicrobium cerasi]|uniref:RNA polymerase sigma factor n=1 Tax=Ornithinimicrobium cerasi TaxID=2248773 RepID=UPI00192A47EF|nr:RNA polymerase sigma factor [Ornithinimicrobium cerasi]